MHHKGIVLKGIDDETELAYQSKYRYLDPSHPSNMKSDERVVFLADITDPLEFRSSTYYKEFLKPRDIEHVADMYFRHEDRIIAVIGMLRNASLPPFSANDMQCLTAVQRFLEYAINTVYLPERVEQRNSIAEKYSLTERELDVLEWLVSGASNKQIANELGMAMGTVKTHLSHIFEKMGASSRALITRRILVELGAETPLAAPE